MKSFASSSRSGGEEFKGALSIDKIAFVSSVKRESYQAGYDLLTWFINADEVHPVRFSDKLYQYSYNVNDGQLILQFGASPADPKGRSVRFEFNPNKFDFTNECYMKLFCGLDKLKFSNVTRLDLAIDFYSSLNPLFFMDKFKVKNFVCHGRGGVETVYLGSPSSENRIKIYDKKKEQVSKGVKVEHADWWRVESVQKDLKISMSSDSSQIRNPFRNLFYVSKYDSVAKSDFMNLFVYYANREGYQAAIRLINFNNHSRRIKNDLIQSASMDCSRIFDEQIFSVWYGFLKKMRIVGQELLGI